jgi:hypothetical protein
LKVVSCPELPQSCDLLLSTIFKKRNSLYSTSPISNTNILDLLVRQNMTLWVTDDTARRGI